MSATPEDIAGAIADARNYTAPAASSGASNPVAEAIADARASIAPPAPPSRTERFVQGVTDLPVGLGQLATHVAETPLNFVRKGLRKAYAAASGITEEQAGDTFAPIHAADYDRLVQERENLYEGQRQDAQQNGIDWWRIGGNAANPVNYVAPGGVATTVGRVATGAAVGGAVGAAAPSTHPGDFWADKAKSVGLGTLVGAAGSAAFEGVTSAIGAGVRWLRGTGKEVSKEAHASVADAIAKGASENKGIDPRSIDPDVLKAMRQEAQEALNKGVAPSKEAIFNRALANSLPVPVPLTRGQATRDPLQFAKEFGLKQVENVGEPLAYHEQAQNRLLIENLNVMGAKNAPDIVSAGQTLTDHIRTVDNALNERISQAYGAVRNSQGQPASMDGQVAAQAITAKLDDAQLRAFLPKEIVATLDDLAEGKLPLNVKTAQALDKAWSGLQSGKSNYGLSTSADNAIQRAKEAILDAPVTDAAGEESIAAYRVAKQLAKDRFNLIDSTPAYKAVVNGDRAAEPDQFFRKYVMGSTAREAQGLRALVTQVDPNADALIGRTILGEIKAKSINGTEENGAFSQAKFSKFLDPVWQARMKALLPEGLVQSLNNLNRVAEIVQRAPVASVPNRSGTAGTAGNMLVSAMKAGAGEKLASLASRVPGLSSAMGETAKLSAVARAQRGVSEALNPGVTSSALPGLSPAGQKLARLSKAATIPAATLEMTRDAK